MQEAVINFCRIAYASQLLWGKAPRARPATAASSGPAPRARLYPCKGGGPNDYSSSTPAAPGNHQWERLLKVMGREDLLDDPRYATAKDALRAP